MSNFIAGHHGYSGVHVMGNRTHTDACTLSWGGPSGDKRPIVYMTTEPLGKASSHGARSCNAFDNVRMCIIY